MRVLSYIFLLCLVLMLAGRSFPSDDLFSQIEKGDLEQVKTILDQNMNLLNEINDDGMTPLNYASYLGKAEIVGELISRGADVSIGDNDNSLPIHCAAISGDTLTIDLLLSYGADIDARDNNGLTPLIFTLSYRRIDAVSFLLNRNADVTITANNTMSPLHYAVFNRQPDLAGKIIDKGADPSARTRNNQTPLYMALYNADYETAGILLNRGASVQDTTTWGTSLLYYALAYRDGDFVRRMLEKGSSFEQKNILGMTMLHYAAARGFTDIVELLCDKGVDVNARCINEKSALYYATIWDHPDVVQILLQRGADPLSDESPGLSGPFLEQARPGRQPEPFAQNQLLTPFAPHGRLVFSPDGTEMFWCHHAMPIQAMWYSRRLDGIWQRPSIAPFTDPALDYADGSPAITHDGSRLYYHSRRPVRDGDGRREDSDIWYVEKGSREWGSPVQLGESVNTDKGEFSPSVGNSGNLYFIGNEYDDTYGTGDIYVAEYVDGEYMAPKNLGPSVNSPHHELNPAVAPDESYLIFSSDRPAPARGLNLYVTFKNKNGSWTDAVAFGHSITSGNAWHPFITPDGGSVIYLAGDEYYWFSTKAVYNLREVVLGPEPDDPPQIICRKGDQEFGDNSTRKIMLEDLDRDNDLDAVFSCGQVWLNDGNGTFSLKMDDAVERGHGVDIGDVDNDGDIDIVLAGVSNPMYLNDGKGNFEKSEQLFGDSTGGAFHVLLADFDVDGDLDLAAFYGGDSTATYINDGSGVFDISDIKLPGKDACDVDGDGDVDFFVRKRSEGYKVMLNNGHGKFAENWKMPDSSIDYGSVSFEDIDNDGDSDVMVTNGGNNDIYPSLVFYNDGHGNFELSDIILPRSRWGNVSFGDLNDDGWMDAFVSNFTLPNCILINDRTGILKDVGLRLGGSDGNMISAIGDLDGDGDQDIFVSNFEGGANEIWFNQTQ
jgi:ankyrin repeat protein